MSAPLNEGTIVLTATTLGEDAQESDAVGGSFFTHYLLAGLRGAADENGDRLVTVAEAFSYAHAHTVFASSRTIFGTQHPTFHYDLRGRAEFVLTNLSDLVEHGRLTMPTGATWLVTRTGAIDNIVRESRPASTAVHSTCGRVKMTFVVARRMGCSRAP